MTIKKLFTILTLGFSITGASAFSLRADSTEKTKNDYEKIIKKSTLQREGVLNVYESEKKWYLEIPDTLLNRYFLTVTRLIATPSGFSMYGGEKLNEQTIYFEKGNAGRIFLRSVDYRQDAAEDDAIFQALEKSSQHPIISALDIKGSNEQKNTYLVDATDLFKKDNPVLSLANSIKTENKLGSLADDRSFIIDMRSYPINLEVQTAKTYSTSSPSVAVGSQTFTINTSMVLLPKTPMQKRLSDSRVGYFANKFILFADAKQGSKAYNFIQRYRLEPQEKDLAHYRRGELVEPKQPIVYYIDPATPKKWRPYLIAGVNDWNKAFEQAGFKNAIVGKEWPESDTTMSLEDARFSVIRYFASEKANAYGPRISDPRSGEIIESHVGWYHNVMKLLQQWFMVQVGPLDKRAQKMELDDEVMGELIRFVSSHEVGHSLGLRHNMGSSSQTPVEKLRDKAWVEKHGHTVSIMDYARFNYVAQPEDNIGLAGIYPRIGMYDTWAIQWGYQYLPQFADAFLEQDFLIKQTTDSLKSNPKLWFGGEGNGIDPRSQKEDIGDDSMLASSYGLKNLKRVVDNLVEWTATPNDDYTNLKDMHKAVRSQFNRYLYHVLKNIGSVYETEKNRNDAGAVYSTVPRAKVKSAVAYVNENVFTPPMWLYPQDIQQYINKDADKEILDQQEQMLNMLLSPGMLHNLYLKSLSAEVAYPLEEYLADITSGVWTPTVTDARVNAIKRSQQRYYMEKLDQLINPKGSKDNAVIGQAERSDIQLYAMNQLISLQRTLQKRATSSKAAIDKQHYEKMLNETRRIQQNKNK
ncbi:zinc-dependent metalloprotease [Sphingobacterium corticibacter]|uniref:Zinc-dependent metalloprotease n=2 Tax=Sphingobacterium corticibacter TaxID=2171749 RepID=A0A2T8HNY4_9SPHI|nr:zinc-dependent metalloprotease [Sphingobacterium corticibacter]